LARGREENETANASGESNDGEDDVSVSEDEAAVERVLRGDVFAFEGIVRRWQGPLVNLAYRFCRDRGRAQDMAQEAFLRAFRSLASWRREAAFSTWLFALATNVYRTELRRIPPPAVPLDDVRERRDPTARTAEALFADADRDRLVRRAVLSLPAKYRDAMILFYFHDLDIPTAARSLGLAENTVKTRLLRGRELLRNKLSRLFVRRPVERTT
jgi:RNA polymerase sigma-70 factor (ECF subfamily)